MQQMVEYICMVVEEKYSVDLKGNWVCTKDKNLECICLSGEVLNQALSNLLLFFKEPIGCKIILKRFDNIMCPVVEIDGKQYIGILKNDECLLNLNSIKRDACKRSRDDKFYIKLTAQKMEKDAYKLLLSLLETELEYQYANESSCSRRKYRLLLHIIKRMRIIKNRKQLHDALMCLRCFIASGKTLGILNEYVCSVTITDEDKQKILGFAGQYIKFLRDLEEYVGTMRVDVFAEIFEKNWNLDISLMLYDYVNENNYLDLVELIDNSLKENLQKTSLNKWKKNLNKIDGDEWKVQMVGIRENLEYLFGKSILRRNRQGKVVTS